MKMTNNVIAVAAMFLIVAASCLNKSENPADDKPLSQTPAKETGDMTDEVKKTDEQWRQILTPEQYRITRKCGTEPAFSGKYYNFKGKGMYLCVACGNELFSSETKFDSGTGWPSFYKPAEPDNIEEKPDTSYSMTRTEVKCSRCGAHLGHVFDDGPKPTQLRYCINSAALLFADANDK